MNGPMDQMSASVDDPAAGALSKIKDLKVQALSGDVAQRQVAVDDLPLGVQDPKRMDGHFVKTRPHLGLDRLAAARIVALFDAQKQ